MNTRLAVLALATAALAACEPNPSVTGPAAALQAARAADVSAAVSDAGAVYTLTNQVGGNAVAVFARGADGRLSAAGAVSTGGTGTGASLGSQSAVTLSDDGRWLFAVNAGSNDVSVFSVSPAGGLALASRTASGGTLPISLTVHGNVLYVLNAGGTGNISGLAVGTSGALTAIAGTTLPLSGSNVGPAQVSFRPDGRRLVVTEKNTNQLDVYAVDANGVASGPTTTASAGGTPFGFSFGHRNELFVSEATGSASSYELDATGGVSLVSGAVLTHQGAPCWAVVTNDGRIGFTGNGAGSVSAFAIAPDGAIGLVDANGGTALIGTDRHGDRGRTHRGDPALRAGARRGRHAGTGTDQHQLAQQRQASAACGAPGPGSAAQLLGVHLRQLHADRAVARGLRSAVSGARAHDRRHSHARVPALRRRARQRQPRPGARPPGHHPSQRAGQRPPHLGRVQHPLLAELRADRQGGDDSLHRVWRVPSQRRRLPGMGPAHPAAARRIASCSLTPPT